MYLYPKIPKMFSLSKHTIVSGIKLSTEINVQTNLASYCHPCFSQMQQNNPLEAMTNHYLCPSDNRHVAC